MQNIPFSPDTYTVIFGRYLTKIIKEKHIRQFSIKKKEITRSEID